MGIYDRDYYREEQPGISLRAPRTMVGMLILINVAVYVAGLFFPANPLGDTDALRDLAGAHPGSLTHPWLWWQLLTYGFVHSRGPMHLLFNMLALWFLGREVESRYGAREFLWVYLATIVAGGVVWAAVNKLRGLPDDAGPLIGASGAIAAVVALFALNFPRRTVLLFFVLPMPAWVLGVFVVASDIWGAAQRGEGSHVAYIVHLTGAAVALGYFWSGFRFSRLSQSRFWRRRPTLRLHAPGEEAGSHDEPGADLSEQVDRILEKIHREGETSLTRKERRVLESASREYQRRRTPRP